MKVLISYATTEGHTRKVARFTADALTELGHTAEMLCAEDTSTLDLARFDRVILAGSVHAGQLQKSLQSFAKQHSEQLNGHPSMLICVSLCAAGIDEEDWRGLREVVTKFQEHTGWISADVTHVAGAFRFGEYDFFRYWAMRWIAHQKKQKPNLAGDTIYTDWQALKATLADWVGK